MKKFNAKGFTLVELMIATAVFSIIMMVCLAVFLQIGRMYYKGVTYAKAQETSRSILEDISQNIQYGSENPYVDCIDGAGACGGRVWFCVGDKRYTLTRKKELVDSAPVASQSLHVLQREAGYKGGGLSNCPSPANPLYPVSANATELVPRGVQISRFGISKTFPTSNTTWDIGLRVVVGDSVSSDVMEAYTPSVPTISDGTGPIDVRCKAGPGTQFCAESELSTTVTKRLQ